VPKGVGVQVPSSPCGQKKSIEKKREPKLIIETAPLEDHQVKITAEFEVEKLDQYKHKAARKIANQTKIPGFRPGKAPYDVIRRYVGDKALVNEAIELLIDESYPQVIEEAKIKPYTSGNLDEIISYEPPKFSFVVPLEPEVTLGDYRAIRLEHSLKPFDESEVDKFFTQLRTNYSTAEPAEHPAQENDLVFSTYSGTLTSPSEGDDAAVIKETPYQQVIQPFDKQQENELPFKGFCRMLIGSSAGEEREIKYQFPEDDPNEKIRGKEVVFTVKVQSIKSLNLPELNDEFAHNMGGYSSLEEMRSSVRTRLEANNRDEYDQVYYSQIIDQILKTAVIKYPPQALQDEIDQAIRSLENDLEKQKLDLDTYIKLRKTEKEAFIENEIKPIAIRRLERSLILNEISRLENIRVDQKDLEHGFNSTLSQLQVSGELAKIRKRLGDDRLANLVAIETANRLLNQQVLERLKAIATGQEILPESSTNNDLVGEETSNPSTSVDTAPEPETPSFDSEKK
jgi:trigger factor